MRAYKLFRIKNNKLYPLYIKTDKSLEQDVWLNAEKPEILSNGKVKSKLGELAYRPGWHCCEVPLADHIGKRMPDGSLAQRLDSIWCEVEVKDTVDYTESVKKKNARDSYMKEIPVNGYYWYKTNPAAKVRWLISGELKITKVLSNEEVAEICKEHNLKPQIIEKE